MKRILKTVAYEAGAIIAASSFLYAHGAMSVTASRTYVVQETTLHASETEGQKVLFYTLGSQSNKFVVAKDGLDRATRLTPVTEPGTTNVIGYYIGTNVNARVASSDWMSKVSGLNPVYGQGEYSSSVIGYTLGDDTGKVVASADWLSKVTEVKPIISSDDSPSRVVGYTIGTNAYVFASDKSVEVQQVKKVTGSTTNVVGYTIGGNTNNVFMSEYGVRQVIPNYPAVSNAAMRVADRITDGTNIIDAAGNVFVSFMSPWTLMTNGVYAIDLLFDYSQNKWTNVLSGAMIACDYSNVTGWCIYSQDTGMELYSEADVPESALSVVFDNAYTMSRSSVYENKLVGKLALTNDIPSVVPADLTPATNYTDTALSAFAATGAVARANVYGTQTRWTDATGCVWEVSAAPGTGYTDWICYGVPDGYLFLGIEMGPQSQWRLDLYDNNIYGFYTYGATNAAHLVFNVYGVMVEAFSKSTVTNLMGRVALTNDIDYSTSNAQLVATIEAKAPAPGNYPAVSNAAMNARSMTDLGVRGAPHGEGSWFVVDGYVLAKSPLGEFWSVENLYQIVPLASEYQLNEWAGGCWTGIGTFVLNESFSSVLEGHTIIGYTNALAQVSQIPTIPHGLVTTNSSGGVGANLAVNGVLYVSKDDSPNFGASTNTGVRITKYGTISIMDAEMGRGLSISSDSMFMVDTSTQAFYEYVFPANSGTIALDTDLAQKQDKLPYPANAIPYAAISGAPSLAGQTFDFSRNYDIIRATAAIAEALGATVTNNPTAQGGN